MLAPITRPPIDPDAPYLPVPVEKDSVGRVTGCKRPNRSSTPKIWAG